MKNNGNGNGKEMQLACGLGWLSVGLGLAEVMAPGAVGRMAGIPGPRGLIRMFGLREIASGLGIFAQRRPSGSLWSRVAGDALDLAVLTAALGSRKASRGRIAVSLAAVAGVTALDIYTSQRVTRNPSAQHGNQHVTEAITINDSAENLYAFWRAFENLPRFMAHLKSVTQIDGRRWHWVAKGPMDSDVEWDAELVEDLPNELISWRSLPDSEVETAGSVQFERAAGGRGTIVRVSLEYRPPAGALGAAVAKLFGEAPEKQVPLDLRRFKQLIETGEIIKTEGQPAGRSRSTSRKYDDFLRK